MSRFCFVVGFACVLAACSSESPDSPPDDVYTEEELRELSTLVHEYVDTPDAARGWELMAEILAHRAANLANLTAILGEPRSYTMAGTGILEQIPLTVGQLASDYWMYVPESYDPTRSYPLVVCLHGAVSNGGSYLARWQPRLGEDYILACPTAGGWWFQDREAFVLAMIDEVVERYNIDPNRMLLTGMSDGGSGTYTMGVQYADRFAGLAPMAAGFGEPLMALLESLYNTPLYIIHGSQDGVIPVSLARAVVAYLEEFGYQFVYREHDLVHPQAGGHFFPEQELPALVEWFAEQTRNPYPARVRYVKDSTHIERFFWTSIEDTETIVTLDFSQGADDLINNDVYAAIDATIVGNRIDVDTRYVKTYQLFLNGSLVDLTQPVEIYTNGTLSRSGLLTVDLQTLLLEARIRQDRAMLFPVAVTIDVP